MRAVPENAVICWSCDGSGCVDRRRLWTHRVVRRACRMCGGAGWRIPAADPRRRRAA